MNTQKGFANILIIIIGLVVIGGGSYVYYSKYNQEILIDEKGNEYVVVDDMIAPKEIAEFVPTKKELSQEFEKRTPETDDENFRTELSRLKLTVKFDRVRIYLKEYYNDNQNYIGFCDYFYDELLEDIINEYNSESVDDYTGVMWYPEIESVPGLNCVDSSTSSAITFEVVEDDFSKTLKCVDSSLYIGDGNIVNNLCSN